jgi:hypothetical protein
VIRFVAGMPLDISCGIHQVAWRPEGVWVDMQPNRLSSWVSARCLACFTKPFDICFVKTNTICAAACGSRAVAYAGVGIFRKHGSAGLVRARRTRRLKSRATPGVVRARWVGQRGDGGPKRSAVDVPPARPASRVRRNQRRWGRGEGREGAGQVRRPGQRLNCGRRCPRSARCRLRRGSCRTALR